MKEVIVVPDDVSSSSNSKEAKALFEIKVAIIGHVSAGKTTVLNALFRDKYGEVSMKRTTAGVNEFVISSPSLDGSQSRDKAKSILTEITKDNAVLRASKQGKTRRFDVQVETPLCEMRKDTQLVIVDIPGINEANASQKYKTYVEDNWNTFDCVVVVMDGRQGVNTDEQVSLLRFVKTNLNKCKDIPVMILCNKIDDPDDKEQMEMVLEAQYEVEKMFGVPDRQKSLEEVLQESPAPLDGVSPVFIPISGITAFVFQSCSGMSLETFRKFDEELIDKLGRERIGKRKWKRLSKEEQIQQAHKAVSDPEGYKEGIEDSNFDKVLSAFSYLMSGSNVQEKMIQKQIEVSLSKIRCEPGIVDKLEASYTQIAALSETPSAHQKSLKELKVSFWRLCETWETQCFSNHDPWKASEDFAPIADELKKYHEFAESAGWEDEADKAVACLKTMVQRAFKQMKAAEGFVDNLSVVHQVLMSFFLEANTSAPVAALQKCFDKLYQQFEKEKLQCFTGADTVYHLAPLADELVKYAELARGAHWDTAASEVCKKFKFLVLRQICKICELASEAWSDSDRSYRRSSLSFDDLGRMDWKTIVSSILLLRYERRFCMDFGREIVWMEHLVNCQPVSFEQNQSNGNCPTCSSVLTFNRFCVQCSGLVTTERTPNKCLGHACSARNVENTYLYGQSGPRYYYRCGSCNLIHLYGGSEGQNPPKYHCPDCKDQVLDFNRRCAKCKVFFHPSTEKEPQCPIHKCKPSSQTGKCGSCRFVWKRLPSLDVRKCPKLKCTPNGLELADKQLQQEQLFVPATFGDPEHFGNLAWRYCEFMRSQN